MNEEDKKKVKKLMKQARKEQAKGNPGGNPGLSGPGGPAKIRKSKKNK